MYTPFHTVCVLGKYTYRSAMLTLQLPVLYKNVQKPSHDLCGEVMDARQRKMPLLLVSKFQ